MLQLIGQLGSRTATTNFRAISKIRNVQTQKRVVSRNVTVQNADEALRHQALINV